MLKLEELEHRFRCPAHNTRWLLTFGNYCSKTIPEWIEHGTLLVCPIDGDVFLPPQDLTGKVIDTGRRMGGRMDVIPDIKQSSR